MDFEKNPLVNDISRCQREVKRWLALVALTLAALLTVVCIDMVQLSPASREIANFLMIASVTAIICSLFGVKQSNDHCRSVQYGLSVFEAMKKDLEGTESELTSARYDVTDAQSDLYFAKKNAKALQDELASVKSELSEAKLKLRRKEGEAQLAERCYEDLRKACSETTLDLLRTKRERDDLQSELATARRFARRLLAERNELIAERDELRYQLVEARIGFEFFQGEYIKAGALIADAKKQIKDLERDVKIRDKVIGSLLDDVVIRTKG